MRSTPRPAVVGHGSSRYEKRPTKGLIDHLWESVDAALANAGVLRADVDGLAVSSFGLAPGNAVTLAEHFGMQLSWAHQGVFGGASGVIMTGRAVDAIRERQARTIVVVAGDTYTVASHDKLIDSFTPSIQKYLSPHGFGGANGVFALVQSRHTDAYGTTREQLGRLAVTQRANAQLNDNALLRDDMTMDDYLNARLIAEPLRLYDCVMPCAGAEAIVLVDETTYDGPQTPLRLLAQREVHNPYPDTPSPIRAGWEIYSDELFEAAGVTRDDIDFVQLYDDYPIMEALQLEGLGFCSEGQAGPFLEETDISLTGKLPVNTGGGQLSAGQSGAGGGMIGVTEAVRQLQHEGGERQVPNASIGLVSGFGLVSYAKGLCASAMILQRPT